MLSKPCLSLSFAFIWKAKCLLLLLLPPPCHDQDHLHIAWDWDETPLSLCLYLSYSLDDMSFLFFQTNPFSHCFLSVIHHAFLWFLSTWDGLHCVRGLCVCTSSLLLNAIRWLKQTFRCRTYALIEYSRLLLYQHQHKAHNNNMLPDRTNLDHSSHVGQADSNPPDAANCLLPHRTLRKCVQPCAIGHTKKVGGVTNLKSKLKGDMSL